MTKYELSDTDKMGVTKHVKVFIFYELQSTIDLDRLISSILEGVRNTTRQLPFMAGHFQADDSGQLCIVAPEGSQVNVNVRRFEPTEEKSLFMMAKDSSPNEQDLAQLLPQESAAENLVCALQLSVIEGDLILGLRMNHAAGDWSSIDTFLSLICRSSKAYLKGLEMPTYKPDLNRAPYDIPASNAAISRHDLLERLPVFQVIEKSEFKRKPLQPTKTSIYKISESSIQQLKARCNPYLKEVEYISSYDCISALMWTSITRTRLHLHPVKAASPSRFIHPIDVRTRDPEHKTSERYFGNAVIAAQAGPLTAQTLVSDSDRDFATAASLIRQSVRSVSLASISDMNSLNASLSPTEMLLPHADFTDMDMFMNTWYSGTAQNYDLGPALVPVACRVHLPMVGACTVILPNFSRDATRNFEVVVHLAVEEHELLRKDAEFLKYFEAIT